MADRTTSMPVHRLVQSADAATLERDSSEIPKDRSSHGDVSPRTRERPPTNRSNSSPALPVDASQNTKSRNSSGSNGERPVTTASRASSNFTTTSSFGRIPRIKRKKDHRSISEPTGSIRVPTAVAQRLADFRSKRNRQRENNTLSLSNLLSVSAVQRDLQAVGIGQPLECNLPYAPSSPSRLLRRNSNRGGSGGAADAVRPRKESSDGSAMATRERSADSWGVTETLEAIGLGEVCCHCLCTSLVTACAPPAAMVEPRHSHPATRCSRQQTACNLLKSPSLRWCRYATRSQTATAPTVRWP